VVTDTLPANTTYILGSASSGGQLVGDIVQWLIPILYPGESIKLSFQVNVEGGSMIVNDSYAVRCSEGVYAYGDPVVTPVWFLLREVHLPLTFRY
jgi:hypothetical protein